jgi:SlyX protein
MNTDERFTDLETKLVYCEDLIQQLNTALSSQQLQMDDLRLAVEVLSERLKEATASPQQALTPGDERPPHY